MAYCDWFMGQLSGSQAVAATPRSTLLTIEEQAYLEMQKTRQDLEKNQQRD